MTRSAGHRGKRNQERCNPARGSSSLAADSWGIPQEWNFKEFLGEKSSRILDSWVSCKCLAVASAQKHSWQEQIQFYESDEIFYSFECMPPVDPRRVLYQVYKAEVLHARESLMFHQFILVSPVYFWYSMSQRLVPRHM